MKFCKDCRHYVKNTIVYDPTGGCDKCTYHMEENMVTGIKTTGNACYDNSSYCYKERTIQKTLWGKIKDTCGTNGKYFEEKS